MQRKKRQSHKTTICLQHRLTTLAHADMNSHTHTCMHITHMPPQQQPTLTATKLPQNKNTTQQPEPPKLLQTNIRHSSHKTSLNNLQPCPIHQSTWLPSPTGTTTATNKKHNYNSAELRILQHQSPLHITAKNKTGRFAIPNGPFQTAKRAVLGCKTALIDKRLGINKLAKLQNQQ